MIKQWTLIYCGNKTELVGINVYKKRAKHGGYVWRHVTFVSLEKVVLQGTYTHFASDDIVSHQINEKTKVLMLRKEKRLLFSLLRKLCSVKCFNNLLQQTGLYKPKPELFSGFILKRRQRTTLFLF